jgi:hypothetical protein
MRNKPLIKEPYIYSGQVTLTANSTGQIIFQIASNFNYFMTRFSYKSSIDSANGIANFDIQFLKNEHQIFYDYVPCEIFSGLMYELSTAPDTRYINGLTNWFKFDVPYKFEAKSNLIINLRDTSGQANTVRMAIAGYKDVWFV